MIDLIESTPNAKNWVHECKNKNSKNIVFGEFKSGVVWTDDLVDNGKPVGGDDPLRIIQGMNNGCFPLFHLHDEGRPIGRVLSAKLFTTDNNRRFVAAILGVYNKNTVLSFKDFNVNINPDIPLPKVLTTIPSNSCFIEIITDPREVSNEWLKNNILNYKSPVKIIGREYSNNSAYVIHEIIKIGIPYIILVWNPLVTSVAQEAGKAIYSGIHSWLKNSLTKFGEKKSPVISIKSNQNGCDVSFIFRGNDVSTLNKAHESLSLAAVKAAKIIQEMEDKEKLLSVLVYEFEPISSIWYPSYATLKNGTLISDKNLLIAFENLPRELSLGLLESN